MKLSNVHLAYGDNSVYQQIVGCSQNIEDGNDTTDWRGSGVKLRAVKDIDGKYVSVVRDDEGALLYEGNAFTYPMNALLDAKFWYASKF